MKKIFLIMILAVCALFISSCSSDDNGGYRPYPEPEDIYFVAFEITRNFSISDGQYIIRDELKLENGNDMILIYRLFGLTNDNRDVWQLLPNNAPFRMNDNTIDYVDYNFDFDNELFEIQAYLRFDQNINPEAARLALNNQTFRILRIPVGVETKSNITPIDHNDYEAVIKYYNIDESKIKTLK